MPDTIARVDVITGASMAFLSLDLLAVGSRLPGSLF